MELKTKDYKKIRIVLFLLIFLCLVIWIYLWLASSEYRNRQHQFKVHKIDIKEDQDKNKLGQTHSRLFHGSFHQESKISDISENVIQVYFDHDVEILGFLVSLDHTEPAITLVEVAATVNSKEGYRLDGDHDAIIHTSYVGNRVHSSYRKTDEKVFFPPGFGITLKKNDFISIGAFMTNVHPYKEKYVSGEFIVYYRWLGKDKLN